VFVEAFKSNIDKMIPFIEKADATDRSLILQGAATAACPSPVVQFSVPDVDESKAPHWYAREVGRITTKHELNLTDWKHIDVSMGCMWWIKAVIYVTLCVYCLM